MFNSIKPTRAISELKIGILCGANPMLTVWAHELILQRLERDWRCGQDSDYPTVFSYGRTTQGMLSPRIGIREQAVAQLARRAEALQKWGCSHVLIPCDQAQIYVPEVQRRVSVPIGDTTGLVCEAIKSSGAKAVRLIGSSALPTAGRYLELLATSGVELLHWSAEEQALLNEATKLGASRMTATQSNDLRTLVRAKDDKEVVRVVTSYELHRAQLGASQAPQIDAMRIAADAVVGLLMG